MRGSSRHFGEPVWAQPGPWDWTVTISFIATSLLCFGMLFSSLVFGHEDTGCPENMTGLQRMIGPTAWYAFDECVPQAPAVAR